MIAYISSDLRWRSSVRTVLMRELPNHGGLERATWDTIIGRPAVAVGLTWDGARGAVVYVVPRPHRGEDDGDRRRRVRGVGARATSNPTGNSALTAGDIMLQRLDANGAPIGRPILAFEENARTFRVAVAPDGDGWLLAWTGAIVHGDEVLGTVRTIRVNAQGQPRSYASDTGFTGQVGDVLRVLPRGDDRHGMRIVWTGERCRSRTDVPPWPAFEGDPSAAIETRVRQLMNQNPPHEHPGPRLECTPVGAFAAEVMPDGSTRPIVDGPALASDTLATLRGRDGGVEILGSARTATQAQLTAWPLDAAAHVGRPRVLASSTPATRTSVPATQSPGAAGSSSAPEPSTVAPPSAPTSGDIVRVPAQLDAFADGDALDVVALSPTRARVVISHQRDAAAVPDASLLAPGIRAWDVALAGARGAGAWVLTQVGSSVGGPLLFIDPATAQGHVASAESPWLGDERLRRHLLRVLAARAADTAFLYTYGPMVDRPENAANPNMPGMASSLRRLRSRWDEACNPLQERARWLVHHGGPPDVAVLARLLCEIPAEPVMPAAVPGAPGAVPGAAPAAGP